MRSTAFEVAGIHLQFNGESSDIETLERLFWKFPTPRRLRPEVAVVLDCNRCSWRMETSAGSIRLLDPNARTAAATMLLARLLSEARPDLVVLHGNGLRHPDGHPILILGDSGAGKTTLTRQLLASPFDYSQIAEDVLILDPASALLHPFPRALAIRTPQTPKGAKSATFGFADETRQGRPLEEFSATPEPTPLSNSSVFLLGFAPQASDTPTSNATAPSGECAWISWADEETAATLRQAGLPASDLRIGPSVAEIHYSRVLTNEERALQHRLFEQLEILHLHSQPIQNPVEPEAPLSHPQRPESPKCESLTPGDGVRCCLSHLRRVTGAQSRGEASRVFIHMAKALSSAKFYRFIPGGTPEQSAALLARHAARESSPV